MKRLSNRDGFTLVEIMIAAAALGGLALVGMQMTKTQTKSITKASFDSEIILVTNEIVAILSDPNKCFTTLGGKNASSTVSGINSINGNKYYSLASGSAPANGYGNANLNITSYALSATSAEISSNNSALLINYQNKNILKGSSGPSTFTKKINLYVEVDGSTNITKCRSLSSSSSDIWTRGSGSTINYSGGNVGIGTTTPGDLLEVFGGGDFALKAGVGSPNDPGDLVFRDNSGIEKARVWSQATAGAGLNLSGRSNATPDVFLNSTGNVGIGTVTPQAKLEVNGGIKPGAATTGSSCGSNPEGSFAYDMAAHAPVYCNNSGVWATMGGGTSPIVAPVQAHGVNDGGAGFSDNCPAGYSMTGLGVYGNVMYLYCTKFN